MTDPIERTTDQWQTIVQELQTQIASLSLQVTETANALQAANTLGLERTAEMTRLGETLTPLNNRLEALEAKLSATLEEMRAQLSERLTGENSTGDGRAAAASIPPAPAPSPAPGPEPFPRRRFATRL